MTKENVVTLALENGRLVIDQGDWAAVFWYGFLIGAGAVFIIFVSILAMRHK